MYHYYKQSHTGVVHDVGKHTGDVTLLQTKPSLLVMLQDL